MSRIFISHSSKNNAEVLALREWLASQGWNDVFLDIDPERGLVAADRWQKALNNAIGRCRAVIFLLSPDWVASKHCISELDLAGHIGAQRIGVIVQDIPLDEVPTGLGGEQQVINLTRGGTPVSITVNPPPERQAVTVTFPQEDLLSLRAGLAKLGLVGFETDSFPWPPADEPDRAPYRGLQALDVKDAGVFYGRDSDLIRAREELLDLRERGGRKLFCVVGASGSGKSSFLRAGLLPRLEREDRDFWVLPLTRPQTSALSGSMGLAAALEKAFAAVGDVIPLGELLATLETDEHALPRLLNRLQVQAVQKLGGGDARPPTIVLAVDQAEELFTVDANQEAARMRQHLAAALTRGPDTIGLLTIRSDRFSLLQNDKQLTVLIEPFHLPPVDASVYRDAILRPAARSNPPIEVDERLVETLIKDTAAEGADPLPLLAFTLERLYWRYGKALQKLEPDHYEALGGLTGSIEAAIAEAFDEPGKEPAIPADRKERERLLEAAFIPALVDVNPANGEPLSRIANEREMPADARSLVERLVNARLLVSDEGDGGKTYRVAHEAILRRWAWLRALLEQKASLLNTAHVIEQQAEAWDKAERSKAWLDLRGERLREAAGLAARNDFKARLDGLPVAYLAACSKQQRSERWRGRRGLAFIMAMVIGIVTANWYKDKWFPYVDVTYHLAINWKMDFAKPGTTFKECFECPEMVAIPPGSFMMGSPEGKGEKNERPQHKVTIAKPFAVSKFEVTFAQWDACVDRGGCSHLPDDGGYGHGQLPVGNVSWHDAQQYVKWLSKLTGSRYRLLTEAEWEYAARAGTTTTYSWGDEVGKGNANCQRCWDPTLSRRTIGRPVPVGSFKANAFGLYDVHGNVWEWVQDCEARPRNMPKDGPEALDAQNCLRGLRGGSWQRGAKQMRSANRGLSKPKTRILTFGFRIARDVAQ